MAHGPWGLGSLPMAHGPMAHGPMGHGPWATARGPRPMVTPGTWYLAPGAVRGVRHTVTGAWYQEQATWYHLPRAWGLVLDTRHLQKFEHVVCTVKEQTPWAATLPIQRTWNENRKNMVRKLERTSTNKALMTHHLTGASMGQPCMQTFGLASVWSSHGRRATAASRGTSESAVTLWLQTARTTS